MINLYGHQQAAIEQIRASFQAGNKRVLLAAPCGFGKTIVSAWMAKEALSNGKRVLFAADRVKLVDQTLAAFDKFGIDYGVIQADHPLTDYSKPCQIASIQTLGRRRNIPDYDLCIVDECHTAYKSMTTIMDRRNVPKYVGLSATPYSRGLGLIWQDLITPITTEKLIEQGFLTPIHYFGGRSVDVSKLKTKALATGGSDYDPNALEAATDADTGLVGDIVRNWLEHGENRQTIAFCPSIKQSKFLVDEFKRHGIDARHIDGYDEESTRREIYQGHESGEFKILSCSKLLGVGYDSPNTSCLIDARPTKSVILYQQAAGRVIRSAPGKEYAVYLDHAGNVQRHGMSELLVPESLDNRENTFSERKQVKKDKPEEAAVNECGSCGQIMQGLKCKSCGYEIHITKALESTNELLVRLTGKKKAFTQEEKSLWYSNLLKYARQSGFKDGWAAYQYKSKFKCWPRKLQLDLKAPIQPEVVNYIASRQIAYARRRAKQ